MRAGRILQVVALGAWLQAFALPLAFAQQGISFKASVAEGDQLWLPPSEVVIEFARPVRLTGAQLIDSRGKVLEVDLETAGRRQRTHVLALSGLGVHRYKLSWSGQGQKGADASGVLRFSIRGCVDPEPPF